MINTGSNKTRRHFLYIQFCDSILYNGKTTWENKDKCQLKGMKKQSVVEPLPNSNKKCID